ncbi:cytochrome c5 family protein [Marinomonas agarivorans]|nr:cytochrome c5 family protein [Marinomonas agarivorans]
MFISRFSISRYTVFNFIFYITLYLRIIIVSLVAHCFNRKVFSLLSITAFSAILSSTAHAYGQSPEEITSRITPVGSVCVAGQECEVASAAAATTSSGPRSGEAIYGQFCIACHSVGVAGAPKFGNAGDWAPRVAKGMSTIVTNAINGINAMPARGTCGDCSDEEIQVTVEYMVNNSK